MRQVVRSDLLVGRTIVTVDHRPFSDGRGGTAHSPIVTLDDGSRLMFYVEEIESDAIHPDGDCYGVAIIRKRKGPPCRDS